MGSGKQNKITITNDTWGLSKEDIDRMVNDAEKYKAEDEQQKDRIAAKNGLESYIFSMKSSLGEEQIKSRLAGEEVSTITTALDETMDWLDRNQLAETEEFRSKQQELEKTHQPGHDQALPGRTATTATGRKLRSTGGSVWTEFGWPYH